MYDAEKMQEIAKDLYLDRIADVYGEGAGDALRRVLRAVHDIHGVIPYETVSQSLTIYTPVDAGSEPLDLSTAERLRSGELLARTGAPLTILTSGTEVYDVWAVQADLIDLAASCVVYYFDGQDHFVIDGVLEAIPNPSGFPSAFGTPTFIGLDRALADYAEHMARHSSCLILRGCWEDGARTVFVNKPEATMRRSLHQFLGVSLRGYQEVEVREEQTVDGVRPVDIKVTWNHSRSRALIEVKWVGNSRTLGGGLLQYRDARARAGAEQVCDYLDLDAIAAPGLATRGYLVVFDGRRRNGSPGHYRGVSLQFHPEHDKLRDDFVPPSRWFMEESA